MSHFHQKRRKQFGSSTNLNFSWPIDSGRNTPISSPTYPAFLTRPGTARSRHSADQQSSPDVSWYSDEVSSETEASTRRESKSSDDSNCSGVPQDCCIEQRSVGHDKLPSQKKLDLAGEVEIFDGNGEARPFKSLYQGSDAIGEQQLIIFIRHFFCPGCQQYLKAIRKTISMKQYFSLPVPTSITIIGLGDPKLIPLYRKVTGTKFPIFADPTRSLHRLLGMSWSLNLGKRPSYAESSMLKAAAKMSKQTAELVESQQAAKNKGGHFWWVGGEFLIRDGKVIWCHRMKNYQDHVEMDVLKNLLGVDSA